MEKTESTAQESISGTVEHFVYKNEENGFSVLHLRGSSSSQNKICVKGLFPGLVAGEFAQFKGTWERHSKFGLQFQAKTFERSVPTNASGIEKYLSSGLIKGVGPEMAKRLVAKFGNKTLEVIDKNPEMLTQVSGIGDGRALKIQEAWQDQREISQVMVFLRSKDVPVGLAGKIYKRYGQESIEKITQNPYRLSEEIWGVGFKTSDSLAIKLGIDIKSPNRVRASIIHLLKSEMDKGHLYLNSDDIKKLAPELLGLEPEEIEVLVSTTLGKLFREEKISAIKHNDQTFIALPSAYGAEKSIARRLKSLMSYPTRINFDPNKVYKQLREQSCTSKISLSEDQQQGIILSTENKVTIITGGPGTGKTTLLKTLLDVFEKENTRISLAAPTGRASKRMFEGTGRSSKTLHRLLEFSPQSMKFERNSQNTLETDVLIIDEVSMLDVFLMHSILKALPLHARLIMLGDVDQLPSVGAGNILSDLIESEKIPTIRLSHIFRQAQGSLIVQNAHRINSGEFPTNSLPDSRKDFLFVPVDDAEKLPTFLKAVYSRLLPKHKIAKENSILLTPMHRGSAGAQNLNFVLQEILNPEASQPTNPKPGFKNFESSNNSMTRSGKIYRNGDRVMQIKNNYDKFVFNGDIGTIASIDQKAKKMSVRFGDKLHIYESSELDELTHSYAVSIHKSQGSEFDAVIIPLFCQHFIMLQRNLLYTAITRSKKLCVLVGETKAIAMAIKNNKTAERKTFLVEYMTTSLEAEAP
jgi:exodeoxyribonuclease V alpha subunit